MKKIDFKSLFTPFVGSVAHSVCAVMAALLLTAGLIFSAHLLMHKKPAAEKPETPNSTVSTSSAESEAAE